MDLPCTSLRPDLLHADRPLDLFVLPGLAFDRSCRRCGRGGGFYDSFLASYLERCEKKGWKRPYLIAIALDEQIRDEDIPVDAHDKVKDT